MPKYDNITEYECDRCGRKLFAAPGDQEAKLWGQPERMNAKGDRTAAVLCPSCLAEYSALTGSWDAQFSKFLNGKG